MRYKQAAKSNNLVQRFLDKHAPKVDAGKAAKGGGGQSLHLAMQELAKEVRKSQPSLMGMVATVTNKIEEDVNLGRARERGLMLSMVEMLEDNVESVTRSPKRTMAEMAR